MSVSTRPPRPWLAALLSVLHVTFGYAYLGMFGVAIGVWAALLLFGAFALWVLTRWAPILGLVLLLIAALGVRFTVAAHCWRLARRAPGRPRPSRLRLAAILVVFLLAAFIVETAWRQWMYAHVARAYRVPSGAMEPTIAIGDWFYVVPGERRALGEDRIVTYTFEGVSLIKRVAAVAGDTVAMRAGRLYRNGKPVAEPWAHANGEGINDDSLFTWQAASLVASADRAHYHPTVDDWGPLVVPANHFFVLGDNRHNSRDSRFVGFIPNANVIGRPTYTYFSWSADSSRVRWNRIGRAVE